MNIQVAVVGASGYVGKHLCQSLVSSGVNVISFSAGKKHGISLETGLFPESLVFPIGLDTVYFLAQSPRYRQTPEQSAHLFSVNCVAAIQAAEAARRARVRRFIYASTGNVYEPSFLPIPETAPVRRDNWYSLSKVMAEDGLALFRPELDITIVRIFGVYGPHQTNKLVPMIADRIEAGLEVHLDKNPTDPNDMNGLVISLIYIDDLVRALLSLMSISQCECINLSGMEAVSIRKLSTELALCMGLPCNIKMNDSIRAFNLIANNTLQMSLMDEPLISLTEGIERFYHARKRSHLLNIFV